MATQFEQQFPDIAFNTLLPPDQHPGFQYGGFHPDRVTVLPKGHVKESGYQAFRVDVTMEEDRAILLRDGVSIYTNVYRPTNVAKVPAILAWSPYGKSGAATASQNYDIMGPFRMGIPYNKLSGYEKFEGPNPADWCERGYAVVDPDARGAMHSEGDIFSWGPQEAIDIFDTLSWIQKQEWCDGNIVMMGNSWLGIAQINMAARYHHPALKAIAPWEAATDTYHQTACRGGRPSPPGFGDMILAGFAGRGKAENMYKTLEHHPYYDDYWRSKTIDVANIDIPMYLTASYSSGLHSAGSFSNFQTNGKAKKWLRVHSSQEWHDLYRDEAVDDLQKFFDFYARGVQNGWQQTPPIRLSLIGFHNSPARTVHERPESGTYPLERTQVRKFYLDANNMSLCSNMPSSPGETSFEGHHLTDKATFSLIFPTYTELSGWPWLKVFMHCDSATDLDVVIQIRKISASGERLEYANYPVPVPLPKLANTNVAKYIGPSGILRASRVVTLKPKKNELDYPEYTHLTSASVEPLGRVVELDIPIWPIGMVFEENEGIQLDIAGHDLAYPEVGPPMREPVDSNKGKFFVHTGPSYGSYLVLPFIAG